MNSDTPIFSWYLNEVEVQELWAWADCFTADECNKIVEFCKKLPRDIAGVGGENGDSKVDLGIRSSKVRFLQVSPDTQWIFHKVTNIVNYINDNFFKFDLDQIETIQFTEYGDEDKDFYAAHIDQMYRSFNRRKFSVTIQLSDPDSYEGGELKLWTSSKPLVAKKGQGIGIFFPSFLLHEVTPVTKGTRYSLVAWVIGPRFK